MPLRLSRRQLLTHAAAGSCASLLGAPRAQSHYLSKISFDELTSTGSVDWQRASGTSITLVGMHHIWMHRLIPLLPQFTEFTGIEVETVIQSDQTYVGELEASLAGGRSKPDVFIIWSMPEALQNNWLEPLDPYFNDPEVCDLAWYDFDDVVPSARSVALGPDQQNYGISITAEAQTVFINRQLASSIQASPPNTFDDLYSLAMSLKSESASGIAMRARASENSGPWPAAGFVFSHGGHILNEEGVVVLDSPEAIAAIDIYGRILREAGPEGVADYDWFECLDDFMTARTAIGCDSSNFAADIRDPDKSFVAGEVYYGKMPKSKGRDPIANVWHWLAGINSKSDHKEASWLFLQWATSRPVALEMASVGMTTPRISAWESPDFQKVFGQQAAEAALSNLLSADGERMKAAWFHPKAAQILTPFAEGIHEVVAGRKDAETAMVEATEKANTAILV